MSTRQAAHRLGVKPETLYAYVSRGLLTSHRSHDGRTSRFAVVEVERLARRGRPRHASRTSAFTIDVESAITRLDGRHVHYRGHDALALARTAAFEQTAELLWTGTLPDRVTSWPGTPIVIPHAHRTDPGLGPTLRAAAALAALTADPSRRLEADVVAVDGRRLIATLADTLVTTLAPSDPSVVRVPLLVRAGRPALRRSVAGRLALALSRGRADRSLVAVVDSALTLLADHEMAASTLAARVAASTRAGLHGVVAAGMGTLSGPFHGGESERARMLLRAAGEHGVDTAVEAALDRHGRLPGHGHVLYSDGDPRATVLFDVLRTHLDHPVLETVESIGNLVERRGLPLANIDLGLATLAQAGGLVTDAGEAIFTIARIAGWLAHALEECAEPPLRFRARARYVGPEPTLATDRT